MRLHLIPIQGGKKKKAQTEAGQEGEKKEKEHKLCDKKENIRW